MENSIGKSERLWFVLGALKVLKEPTLVNITKATGLPKSSVNDILKRLVNGEVASVTVQKQGSIYAITKWDDLQDVILDIYQRNTSASHPLFSLPDSTALTLFEIATGDSVDEETYESLSKKGYIEKGKFTDLAAPHYGKIIASLTPAGDKLIRNKLYQSDRASRPERKLKCYYIEDTSHVVVFSSSNGHGVGLLLDYTQKILDDYPHLTKDDVEVGIFSGDKHRGMLYAFAKVDSSNDTYYSVSDFDFFI